MVDLDTLGRNMRRLILSAGGLWIIGLPWPAYVFGVLAFVLAVCIAVVSVVGTLREFKPNRPGKA